MMSRQDNSVSDIPQRPPLTVPHRRPGARREFIISQQMKADGREVVDADRLRLFHRAIFDEAGIPVLLVGDSAANVVYGYDTTVPITADELIPLVRGVVRGAPHALVVADLPFGSYEGSPRAGAGAPPPGS